MTSNVKFSLRENIRFRILKEMLANLKQKFPSVGNFILVVDPATTKMISSSVKTVDLIEEGVLALERLELGRKPFPDAHAIYFATPTEKSIDAMIKDFEDADDPQYGNVHLFFTNKVDNELFNKLKKHKPLVERVLTFKEVNLDLMISEENVFNLDMPEALPVIFAKAGQPEAKIMEEKIANALYTVVPNLITFDTFRIFYNKNLHNPVASRVANLVADRIRDLLAKKPKKGEDSDSDEDEDPVPVRILILDREFDPLTPSLTDYYYESLVFEFLNVQNENIIEYEATNNDGELVKKVAALNEKDEVWEKYKYLFINEAAMSIGEDFSSFIRNNSTAKMQRAMNLEDMDATQMATFLKELPAFQELTEKYVLHMTLIERINNLFGEKDLKEIGNLEQSLATGLDAQGKPIQSQKLIALIAQKIATGKLDEETKLRLMIIISFGLELDERSRKSFMQSLPEDGKEVLNNLSYLGLGAQKHALLAQKSGKKYQEPQVAIRDNKVRHIPKTLCRHVPLIDGIAQEIINDKMDPKRYESIEVPEGTDIYYSPTTQKKKNKNKKKEESLKRLPKVVVFIVGGITHAEIRILNEAAKNNPNVNLITGATAIMNVKDYVQGIRNMSEPKEIHQVINIEDE